MSDTYYRIKSQYTIIGHDPDKIEIRYGVWNPMSFYLYDKSKSGTLLPFLLALDGKQSIRDIVKSLNMSRSKAEAVLDQLRNTDLIENKASSAFDFYLEKFSPLLSMSDPKEKIKNLIFVGDNNIARIVSDLLKKITSEKDIQMVIEKEDVSEMFPSENDDVFYQGLEKERFIDKFSHWKESYLVVLMSTLDLVALNQINLLARELQIPWILGAIDGPIMMIGPTFLPGQGPCFGCFEARVGMNMRETARYFEYKKKIFLGNPTKAAKVPLLEVLSSVLCSHVALEVSNYLLTENTYTIGKVLAIYLPTMEIAYNEVLAFSGCYICGEKTVRDDHQLYFDMEEIIQSTINEN